MQDYCGEYRNQETLDLGLEVAGQHPGERALPVYARNPHELTRALECLSRITVGEAMMHASLARKASSKLLDFKRLDYPEMDPPEWDKLVTIRSDGGGVKAGELP